MAAARKKKEVKVKPQFRSDKFRGGVDLGIHGESAFPGDHIAYFWETDDDFSAAVRFLEVGLESGDHCVIFGHDDANRRVRDHLARNHDCEALEGSGRLATIPGHPSADSMLHTIAADFERALKSGGKMLRLLGNIGWGKTGWPAENAILEFEARVTDAVKALPAVVVCMYDVRNVNGHVMLRGAFETHPITICRNVLRENPHYVPAGEFLAALAARK